MTTRTHPSTLAARAAGHAKMADQNGSTSDRHLMTQPFPQPGRLLRAAMEQLHEFELDPPIEDGALSELVQLPRPWDPGSCDAALRSELWTWLDAVAGWVNEEHLWTVTQTGIPECWPSHPHLVHDLAVLACSRYYTTFAVTPSALDDWQRYDLPSFFGRLGDRLGDACQPSRHQHRPREERDISYASTPSKTSRKARYDHDVEH